MRMLLRRFNLSFYLSPTVLSGPWSGLAGYLLTLNSANLQAVSREFPSNIECDNVFFKSRFYAFILVI